MKKHLLSLLVALVATAGSLPMAAQEAYAVLTEADSTLTFYYDNLRSTRPGTKYDIPTEKDTAPGWTGNVITPQEKIKHAVFDASFADYRPTSTTAWFQYCVKLLDVKDIRNLNTANVIEMRYMFDDCSSLTSLDLSSFNTEKVTNMYDMFDGCSSLVSLDLSSFNTENVIEMRYMFDGCSSLASLDLSSFNTANVTDMGYMFSDCSSLASLDLTNFNTEKVTNMYYMFFKCSSLASLDLSSFNTANVTNMYGMFMNCSSLVSLDLTGFNTANVTDMANMFTSCSSLTSLNLANFNTEKVTNMDHMFYRCSSLASLNLTKFNTANVTKMSRMFYGSNSLTTIYCNDDWSVGGKVEEHGQMFSNCPNLKGEGAAYDSSKTGIEMANPTTGYFTTKTTGIDHVTAAGKVGDGKIYDLSGRHVSKNYKGVVVTNGRKILQR